MLILRHNHIKFQKKNFGIVGDVGNTAGGIVNKAVDTTKQVAGAGLEAGGGAVKAASSVSGLAGAALGSMGMLGPLGLVGGFLAGKLLKKPIKKVGESIQDAGQSLQS